MIEAVLSAVGYLLMQLVAESFGYAVFHQLERRPRRPSGPRSKPVSTVVAALAWGAILGGASVLLVREPLFPSRWPGLSIVLVPLGLGRLAQFIGDELERGGRPRNGLLSFMPTAALTFGFAAARHGLLLLIAANGGA